MQVGLSRRSLGVSNHEPARDHLVGNGGIVPFNGNDGETSVAGQNDPRHILRRGDGAAHTNRHDRGDRFLPLIRHLNKET